MILEENEAKLRDFILTQLESQTFLDKLHTELLKLYNTEAEIEKLDQDDLYNIILKEGIIEKMYPDFWQVNKKFLEIDQTFGMPGEGFFLRLEVLEITGLMIDDDMGFVRIGTNLGINRFLGDKRKYKAPKLIVKEAFYIDLNSNSLAKLAITRDPLFIYVIVEGKASNKRKIVGIKFVEWRFALTFNKFALDLDVGYISSRVDQLTKNNFNVKVRLSINPKVHQSDLQPINNLEKLLKEEKTADELRMKHFFEYSKIWWQEYKSINPVFAERVVKIYAEDVFGIYRPVSVYVKPILIRTVQCIDTAKRFVSLLPLQLKDNLGLDEDKERWMSFSYSLFSRQIDKAAQACLLCSLLLGFGVEAYVVAGLNGKGINYWVLTIEDHQSDDNLIEKKRKSKEVNEKSTKKPVKAINNTKKIYKYIEPSTGTTLDQQDSRVHNLYRSVGSVFNHEYLFANLQEKEIVSSIAISYQFRFGESPVVEKIRHETI